MCNKQLRIHPPIIKLADLEKKILDICKIIQKRKERFENNAQGTAIKGMKFIKK